MIPWERLDEGAVPGGGKLELWRRGDEYVIRVDGHDLMSSRVSGSEIALAERGCARLGEGAPRVLIGGLGMGFTLAAALAALPAEAEVVVAELAPVVVAWNRGPLAHLALQPLDDPRATVHEGDVADLIAGERRWDAILLDVDNGPDGLTRASNSRLYTDRGLCAAHAALRPGGVLAVWSAFDDPGFTARLRRAGFAVATERVRARGSRGARHIIWLARR